MTLTLIKSKSLPELWKIKNSVSFVDNLKKPFYFKKDKHPIKRSKSYDEWTLNKYDLGKDFVSNTFIPLNDVELPIPKKINNKNKRSKSPTSYLPEFKSNQYSEKNENVKEKKSISDIAIIEFMNMWTNK